MATVVIAPDSFKGSVLARDAAWAIADGWLRIRPDDQVMTLPMADGGEGTLDVVQHVRPDCVRHRDRVTGPDGSMVEADWLQLSDTTAVIEMAASSGLPLMGKPDPIGATSRGLGELIGLARERGADRILVALGGSATTDAGLGALEALGARIVRETSDSRGALGVTGIETGNLLAAPKEGITLLTDTTAVMREAPSVFGPQKGATPEDVAVLEEAFDRLLTLSPVANTHLLPGSGAAGGTAWGLASFLGAVIVEGSRYLGNLLGAGRLLGSADYVITGEGRFDRTSMKGKVVGYLHHLAQAYKVPGALVVGSSEATELGDWPIVRLMDKAADLADANARAIELLQDAGEELARNVSDGGWGAWTRTKNN